MYVDMHAHILPCADHGSDGIETSLAQLKRAEKANVDTIVAATHFYKHETSVAEFLSKRNEAYERLCREAPTPTIVLGAEVTLEVGLDETEDLEKLCIGDTKNILIEMPSCVWTPWVFSTLQNIVKNHGLHPIIAHIDRYFDNPECRTLIETDYPLQLNASALKHWSKRRRVKELVQSGAVSFLGSDIHMVSNEYDWFARAAAKFGGAMEEITEKSRIAVGQKKSPDVPFEARAI